MWTFSESSPKICNPVICYGKVIVDLITNFKIKFSLQAIGTKMNSITNIKNMHCYPSNENIFFIKLKQVLNYKVHNVGITASSILFFKVLICGDIMGAGQRRSCVK